MADGFTRREGLKMAVSAGAMAGARPSKAKAEESGTLDVAVIGAGVFGAWTAWHLMQAGRSVVLIDRYAPANARRSCARLPVRKLVKWRPAHRSPAGRGPRLARRRRVRAWFKARSRSRAPGSAAPLRPGLRGRKALLAGNQRGGGQPQRLPTGSGRDRVGSLEIMQLRDMVVR